MSSCLGSVGVSPYSEDEPAKTSRLTLASRAATSTLSVRVDIGAIGRNGILDRPRNRRDGGLVQHVVGAVDSTASHLEVGQIAFDELDRGNRDSGRARGSVDVAALTGAEVVRRPAPCARA